MVNSPAWCMVRRLPSGEISRCKGPLWSGIGPLWPTATPRAADSAELEHSFPADGIGISSLARESWRRRRIGQEESADAGGARSRAVSDEAMWRRILVTTRGSRMKATTFIWAPHLQVRGSTS